MLLTTVSYGRNNFYNIDYRLPPTSYRIRIQLLLARIFFDKTKKPFVLFADYAVADKPTETLATRQFFGPSLFSSLLPPFEEKSSLEG